MYTETISSLYQVLKDEVIHTQHTTVKDSHPLLFTQSKVVSAWGTQSSIGTGDSLRYFIYSFLRTAKYWVYSLNYSNFKLELNNWSSKSIREGEGKVHKDKKPTVMVFSIVKKVKHQILYCVLSDVYFLLYRCTHVHRCGSLWCLPQLLSTIIFLDRFLTELGAHRIWVD